ncbi:MAG: acyl-CoA dehydrogenase family protein [Rhodococcus sp. (in: high G+C Gram-positive bacteria)]
MRFALDAAREDFASSIDAMLSAADVPGIHRARVSGDSQPLRGMWKSLAQLGVTGLMVDAEFGGVGADALDMVVAVERLGRWAVPGPVVESIVAAPVLLQSLPDDQCNDRLTALAAGDAVTSIALEPDMPRALDADVADFVLLVRSGAVHVATVDNVSLSFDPSRALSTLKPGQQIGSGVDHSAAVESARLWGALGCAAQTIGAGTALLDASADHAKSRRQFGRAIGSYQAVKHRLADVLIGLELARPLLYNAALSVTANSPTAARDVSAAKVACGAAAYRSSRAALQIHGAIGYTSEFDLSMWITKVRALQSAWGTAAHHRRRVLEAL